ncbi:hypothetical protein HBI26_190290 [Parastagonospora nodorum]|nr:hypothetical protein HBI06_227480 [Parastagonospora nodorum]KAH4225575.1 hypothetical protein HBI05_226110 [Parastagonospora nodorum]KAH5392686.1 hypothetical protein HBI32_226710 [Parastagonospora nodorum]KAH5561828.1 hypothetical protein HBI26_190290 [Parastagonospora nodorum]KAH5656392.1 hypothetical protein HBI51_047360 [Parastagonospora nodorum]
MDPVSIVGLAASIVQLADASFKIMNVLETIKEGGQDRRKLCDEITVLWMILRNLEIQFAPSNAGQDVSWMKPIDSLAEPNGVFEQLQKSLDEVWEKVTMSESKRQKFKQTLRWPLDQSYVDRTIARIERLKSSIILVANQANITLAREMREDVFQVKQVATDGQFKTVLDWLCPLNCREKQSNITATPGTGSWFFTSRSFNGWLSGNDRWLWCHGIPGAGKTFLASSTVAELQRTQKSEEVLILVLFCSYDTADSQSVDNLVTSLLKQAVQCRKSLPEKLQAKYKEHGTAGTKPKLTEILDILNEVIASSPKTFIILDALDELAEDSKRTTILDIIYNLRGRPKMMVTSREIESIANRFGSSGVYCDGCSKDSPEIYYHCEGCDDFDLCEDCRCNGPSHPHAFTKTYSSTQIRISARAEDVENYISRRIEVEEDLHRMVGENQDLQERILSEIVENAKDMFLLARFHMDALADCLNISEIEIALRSLPQGINDTYDQVMERIEKLSVNRRRAVKRLLQWVSYSKRPLTIRELEHAIAVSRGARELQADHIISAKVLTSLSAGIVIVDENERVRLTHKTAEDYFINRRETFFSDGDVEITERCLAYLQLATFESGPCEDTSSKLFDARLKDYPFYGYASLYWADHARNCDPQIISPQALLFLRRKPLLEASVQALWHLDTESENSWDVAGGIDALHFASYFGLNHIVAQLLNEGGDPNVRDSLGTTPLIYACARGHAQVAEILLEAGALAHFVDRRGSTALLGSVKNRHLELTRMILKEKDVVINAFHKPFNNYTALMLAAWNSDPHTVDALLQRPDLDVNLSPPNSRSNCLIIATCDDEKECVKELLQHPSIDVNHQDRSGYTATHYAALNGYVDTLELLLNAGADTGMEDDQGGRPLQRAIDYGCLDTVELLLKHKADYMFKDLLGRTILHAAAVNHRARILKHLLETCKDLNIDTQGNGGETALHDAAGHGHLATVKVLLKFGARTDVKNKGGFTPVRLAHEFGRTDVLEALRKARGKETSPEEKLDATSIRRADTFENAPEISLATAVQFESTAVLKTKVKLANFEDLNEPSAAFDLTLLHLVCEVPRLEVVEMLLEAGVFVDPLDSFSRTPLILVCQQDETDIVEALVKHGANVNHSFGSKKPWEIAIESRATDTAMFLLSQTQTEVDINSRFISRALGWAAALGELQACQKLVESGAPIHLKNADGMTPSQIAANWEQDEVEKYLSEQEAEYRVAEPDNVPASWHLEDTQSSGEGKDTLQMPSAHPPATEKSLAETMQPHEVTYDTQSAKLTPPTTLQERTSRLTSVGAVSIILSLLAVLFGALVTRQ